MTFKPCIECGEPSERSRCDEHQLPSTPHKLNSNARGYDQTWRLLSERARRLQPWCTDCGTTDDLTCDHSEQAWIRRHQGKPIRLRDVDVVCRSCNARRGRARPTGDDPHAAAPEPRRQSNCRTHTRGGIR
ncbi:hypothetical protein USB125703_02058 [Pseudoclavibacter triregionum]|nr:hypothetical protein USB125703_02058 [Pseudoclavibacter triregionum]